MASRDHAPNTSGASLSDLKIEPIVFVPGPPLRLCGGCMMWNRKPCGEGCTLNLRDPTWEQLLAENQAAIDRIMGVSPKDGTAGAEPSPGTNTKDQMP